MSNKAAPPKRESNLELNKMIDAKVHVKCLGGREIVGTLKGYDELVNLVLDDAEEYLRGKIIVLSNHKFLLYYICCQHMSLTYLVSLSFTTL